MRSIKTFHFFAILLALSMVLDTWSAAQFQLDARHLEVENLPRLLLFGAAIWFLSFPSMARFLIFAGVGLTSSLVIFEQIANHWILALASYAVILVTAAAYFRRHRQLVDWQTLEIQCGPIIRLQILVVYVWATIHKLNTSFFDVKQSCATRTLLVIQDRIPWLPAPDWMLAWTPHLTIAAEGLIPLLLLFRRTRWAGIAMALGLHFVLGIPAPTFSIMAFGFLALYMSSDISLLGLHKIEDAARQLPEKSFRYGKIALTWLILPVIFACVSLYLFEIDGGFGNLKRITLTFFAITGIVWAFMLNRLRQEVYDSQSLAMTPANPFGYVPVVILATLGLGPHLGIKNTQSFAMYSNLETSQGETNHFFLPEEMQVSDRLHNVIQIRRSSDPLLAKFSQPMSGTSWNYTHVVTGKAVQARLDPKKKWRFYISEMDLRRRLTQIKNYGINEIKLSFFDQDYHHRIGNLNSAPHLTEIGWFERKFLKTRSIPYDYYGLCMW